eukprot:g2176.t1
MSGITIDVRRADLDDQTGISSLVNATPGGRGRLEDRYGEFTIASLVYKSYLSITAVDAEQNIIGFASFSATPNIINDPENVQPWLDWISSGETSRINTNIGNTLWLSFSVSTEGIEGEIMAKILHTAFSTLPEVEMAAYMLPNTMSVFPDIDGQYMQFPLPEAPKDAMSEDIEFDDMPLEYNSKLYISSRNKYIPDLLVRDALVEDYDDLVEVFETQSKSLKEQYGEFFLAELIESQDERNKALVGQVDGRAVGLMSLTCDVDLTALQQCFELEPYNNLETGVSEDDLKLYKDAIAAQNAEERRLNLLEKYYKAADGKGPRLIVLGAPGIGKTTLCKKIAQERNVILVQYSEIENRANDKSNKTEVAQCIVDRLLEDDCQEQGWILDSFPRNAIEVNALVGNGFKPHGCLLMAAQEETVMKRFCSQLIDPETGTFYHDDSNMPEEEEIVARLQAVNDEEGFKLQLANIQSMIDDVKCVLSPQPVVEEETKEEKKEVEVKLEETEAETPPQICPIEEVIAAGSADEVFDNTVGIIDNIIAEATAAKNNASEEEVSLKEDVDESRNSIVKRLGIEEALQIDPNATNPAAFAVTLFCLDDLYEPRARTFLRKAFVMFPDREYCVVTLPHTAAESSLLSNFTMVSPRPSSTFSHVLYLLHRDGLLASEVRVQRALESHLKQLTPMLSALPNGSEVAEAVVTALGNSNKDLSQNPTMASFVALCRDQVLGVVVLTRKGCDASSTSWMQTAYDLEDYVVYSQHDHTEQAFITHYVINPIFSRCTRFVLREAMRLYNKTCLYYRIYPGDMIAPLLTTLVQAPPRDRPILRPNEVRGDAGDGNQITGKKTAHAEDVAEAKGQDSFALHFLTLKLLSEPKIVSHARIVVIGASDAGMSCLESLMMMPYMQFTRLTLVAPGGLPYVSDSMSPSACVQNISGGPCGYSKRKLQQLSFGSTVRIIDARMVDIDREGNAVLLEDETIVPYDFLLLCSGLQEGTKNNLLNSETDSANSRLYFMDSTMESKRLEENIGGLVESGSLKAVAVYGDTIDAFTTIQGLISQNVPGHIINLYMPKSGNTDDDMNPAPFSDMFVKEQVYKNLGDLGVQVWKGNVLEEIFRDSNGNVCGGVLIEEGNERREAEFDLLVCCGKKDVDGDIFAAVNESGLVYDGRLVVDGRFRTADASIYAAGTLTKHSRRFGRDRPWHDHFNSKEVGQALAKALMEEVDPLAYPVSRDEKTGEATPPTFSNPKGVSTCLPGELYYIHIEAPPMPGVGMAEPTYEFGREMVTNPKDALGKVGGGRGQGLRYCRVVVDVHHRVVSITYLGAQPVEDRNFAGLVGLQESYLNSIEHFYDKGVIPDLTRFLRDDWAVAIYNDRFKNLIASITEKLNGNEEVAQIVQEVSAAISSGNTKLSEVNLLRKSLIGVGGEKIQYKTKKLIESDLIKFLRDNKTLMPYFALPAGTED